MLFPVEATIAIIMKNIILTDITHDIKRRIESPTEFMQFTVRTSLIGSISAAVNLYKKAKISNFIIGNTTIIIIIINPSPLMAFFRSSEYPATVEMASDKAFPTTGIKLSTANFAVFIVT